MIIDPIQIRRTFQGPGNFYRLILLVIVIFGLLKAYLLLSFPYSLWNSPDDYPVLSLAHAVHIDQRLTGDSPVSIGYAQTAHAGLFFQWVSWLAYRLSSIFSPGDFSSRLAGVLTNSEPFWLIIRLLPLFMFVTTLAVIGRRIVTETSSVFFFIILLLIFPFDRAILYGFGYFGNDTFSLPLGVALFLSLRKANDNEKPAYGLWWILVGVTGGLSYLNKLNYIMWSVGVLAGYIVACLWLRKTPLVLIRNMLFFVLGFGGSVLGIGELYLGHAGILEMFARHKSFVIHDGLYGSGSNEPVDIITFVRNIETSLPRYPFFWLLLAVIAAQACWVLWERSDDKAWLESNLPVFACLCGAVVMVSGSAFKHYLPHYLIPLVVVVMCIAWWAHANTQSPLNKIVLFPFAILAFAVSLSSYYGQEKLLLPHIAELSKEISHIRELPIGQGQHRLWTYHVSTKEYMQYFMASLVNSKEVFDLVERRSNVDRQFDIFGRFTEEEIDGLGWRYAIFQNGYYPTVGNLPKYFQTNGEVIRRYETLQVLENRKLKAQ